MCLIEAEFVLLDMFVDQRVLEFQSQTQIVGKTILVN